MILSAKPAADAINAATARRLAALPRRAHLRVVLVGHNAGSEVYVRNKGKRAAELGADFGLDRLDESTTQEALLAHVRALGADPAVTAILVQVPLPAHLDPVPVMAAVPPHKDVDGFSPENFGRALGGDPLAVPSCTPAGILALLDHYGVALAGKEAVVIGKSNIVGKPTAVMLGNRDATVTVCHKGTLDLASHTRRADVLVVAAGCPGLVRGDMVKPGATVIDVGINRLADGKIAGDCDFDAISKIADVSPVPGGVGPMTMAMLFSNLATLAERAAR